MHRVIYASLPSTPPHAEILDIVRSSERNNTRLGCSGVLYFSACAYVQLIEGPEEGLSALMDRIRSDARHTLQWEQLETIPRQRLSPTLPMGFLAPEDLSGPPAAALRRAHPRPQEGLCDHLLAAAAGKYPSAALPA